MTAGRGPEALFGPGERLGHEHQYEVVKALSPPTDEGQVYLVKKGWLKRAFKAVRLEQMGSGKLKNSVATVEIVSKEVALLSLVRHTNIVQIADYGTFPSMPASQELLYDSSATVFGIVMELVPGEAIDKRWGALSRDAALECLSGLFAAVNYLHAHGILHMDLKPANILVEGSRPVLIDLGFAVVANADVFRAGFGPMLDVADPRNDYLTTDDNVFLGFTEAFARAERRHLLGELVPRAQIEAWFPDHDLHALGLLIHELVAAFDHHIPGLQTIAHKLVGRGYRSAADARRDIGKLSDGYLAPMQLVELSPVVSRGRYIQLSDKVVGLSEQLMGIVGHPLVQRQRHLPQLELLNSVYPDANQSRFSHSLSVYDSTRRALDYLLADADFRLEVDREDIQAVLLLALLHDVGHYPLSHMFEDMVGLGEPDPILLDEALFEDAVRGTKAFGSAERLKKQAPIEELIQAAYSHDTLAAFWAIHGVVMKGRKPVRPVHRVLGALLNSAVDLDKVAYLLADARFSGVPYGANIDLHGLFRALCYPIPALDDPNLPGTIIGLREKGVAAAESVVLARYWMLSRVYWHHNNRAIMAAFRGVIALLFEQDGLRFRDYLEQTMWMSALDAMRWLSSRFTKAKSLKGSFNPLLAIERGERAPYKRFITVSNATEPVLHDLIVKSTAAQVEAIVRQELAPMVRPQSLDRLNVVADIPRKRRDELMLDTIRVLPDRGELMKSAPSQSLGDVSLVLQRCQGEFLNHVKKCRVYLSAQAFEELQASGRLTEGPDVIRGCLATQLT